MPGYDEDKAESQVNKDILEKEFNLDTSDETKKSIEEIRDMRKQLVTAMDTGDQDPDAILYANIERANSLLDVVYNSIVNGGETNARLFEVAAQLVNAITSASTSVQNSSFGLMKHEYNMKMVEVKEKEVAVKAALAHEKNIKKSGGGSDGNVVVMSREELLKMIDSEEKDVHVKSEESDKQKEI